MLSSHRPNLPSKPETEMKENDMYEDAKRKARNRADGLYAWLSEMKAQTTNINKKQTITELLRRTDDIRHWLDNPKAT